MDEFVVDADRGAWQACDPASDVAVLPLPIPPLAGSSSGSAERPARLRGNGHARTGRNCPATVCGARPILRTGRRTSAQRSHPAHIGPTG
jgi:hypothetical protein